MSSQTVVLLIGGVIVAVGLYNLRTDLVSVGAGLIGAPTVLGKGKS